MNLLTGGDGPEGLRPEGEAFLAGMLQQLPALTAIGAPAALSYSRLVPSHWAGVYACWGNENREGRCESRGWDGRSATRSAHVEWKTPDGAANPYLALGALLAAGLDGVERRLQLPPPVSAIQPRSRGRERPPRLPVSLAAAAERLAESEVVRRAMGEYLHDRVVAVRRAEAEAASGLDEAALADKYRWRF